jgi:hypothetical protein
MKDGGQTGIFEGVPVRRCRKNGDNRQLPAGDSRLDHESRREALRQLFGRGL